MTIKKYELWSQSDLVTEAESALRDYKIDPNERKRGPDLETPTLILHELRHRKKKYMEKARENHRNDERDWV